MVNQEILASVQKNFALTWRELASMFNLEKSHYFKTLQKKNETSDHIELLLLRLEEKAQTCADASFQDPEFELKSGRFDTEYEANLLIKRTALQLKKYTLARQLAEMVEQFAGLSAAIHRLTWAIEHTEHLSSWQIQVIENNRDKCYKELDTCSKSRQLELRARLAGISAELGVLEGAA
jgi:hypothetical protein